jgi:predicted glycosyltransferase
MSRAAHSGTPRVLVTTGGGEDGDTLIRSYLTGVRDMTPGLMDTLVVLGPQLDSGIGRDLRALVAGRSDVTFLDFEADLTARYADADVVVSMAGYNTVCELLTAGVRAVLVPRAEPVQEQLIRARCLAARGAFRMVEPSELTSDRLMAAVRAEIESRTMPVSPIDLEGLTRIRTRVERLLERRPS